VRVSGFYFFVVGGGLHDCWMKGENPSQVVRPLSAYTQGL
jgi:hypothetical protein